MFSNEEIEILELEGFDATDKTASFAIEPLLFNIKKENEYEYIVETYNQETGQESDESFVSLNDVLISIEENI